MIKNHKNGSLPKTLTTFLVVIAFCGLIPGGLFQYNVPCL